MVAAMIAALLSLLLLDNRIVAHICFGLAVGFTFLSGTGCPPCADYIDRLCVCMCVCA